MLLVSQSGFSRCAPLLFVPLFLGTFLDVALRATNSPLHSFARDRRVDTKDYYGDRKQFRHGCPNNDFLARSAAFLNMFPSIVDVRPSSAT
jgi:hypothetical protein